MNRRRFLRSTVVGAGSFLLGSTLFCPNLGLAREAEQKPNILFLFADDQCHEALSILGSEVQTPHLDRLARKGVTFTNAYNQGAWHGAVCVASRTMLNIGRFLWQAKAREDQLKQDVAAGRLWPQYLAGAGYDTYMAGKWHVKTDPKQIFARTGRIRGGMPNQTPSGYDRPKSREDYQQGWKPWDRSHEGFWKGGTHWSEVLADEGVQFLQEASESDKPFFLYLGFNAPHDPRQSPREFVDRYPLTQVKVPESFLPEYPFKDAMGCSSTLRDEKLAPFPRTEYAVKVNRQEYYAIISHMDAQIGRILEALEASGQSANTYIFFTADHGLAVGRHGLLGKQNMFEHSVKAPLLVTGPGIPGEKRVDTPVYLQDIMPTTLELAGLPMPAQVQFKSLLPLIFDRAEKSYEAIYGGYMDLQRMVRKDNFKLICYPKINKILLFDLEKDPQEMTDLAADPEQGATVRDLLQTLRTLQLEVGDSLEIAAVK